MSLHCDESKPELQIDVVETLALTHPTLFPITPCTGQLVVMMNSFYYEVCFYYEAEKSNFKLSDVITMLSLLAEQKLAGWDSGRNTASHIHGPHNQEVNP